MDACSRTNQSQQVPRRYGCDVTCPPIRSGLFRENDAPTSPERRKRSGDAAKASANDGDVAAQLARRSVRQQEQRAGLLRKSRRVGDGFTRGMVVHVRQAYELSPGFRFVFDMGRCILY